MNKQTVMYSQLQPWSTAGAPACMEQVSGPPVPPRTGIYYQTPRPHPWRPTMGYELVEFKPLPQLSITNELLNPCTTPNGMSTEPLRFPNLITGFNRNPQHAARAALYTRYTHNEWKTGSISSLAQAEKCCNASENLRSNVVGVLRKTDEQAASRQLDSGFRIGERITDVTFWHTELNTELEKLVAETKLLSDLKRNVQKAIQDLEIPIHIAQECLYHRESRTGLEKAHDIVEQNLLIEIDQLRKSQVELNRIYGEIKKQLGDCRAAQYTLEEDVVHKEAAIGIDSVCHQLNNFSRGINYYGGIEKYNPNVNDLKKWSNSCSSNVQKSQTERSKSMEFRNNAEKILNSIANLTWDCWSNTNNALSKRAIEIEETKNELQILLQKIQQEIFSIERHCDLLKKAIKDKSNNIKVAQTRLEARGHRSGQELCKDYANINLIKEVEDLQAAVSLLHNKLLESEAQHQELLKVRSNLETDLKNKVNALFIDREKCMSLRKSFPINILIKY